jgi:hypothetical protein
MDIFNKVFTLKTANEIWLKLQLHDGTSNVREQKHCPVLNEYNTFAMKDDELVRDMYSRLNLIINELNSISINKLGDAYIARVLRQQQAKMNPPNPPPAGTDPVVAAQMQMLQQMVNTMQDIVKP